MISENEFLMGRYKSIDELPKEKQLNSRDLLRRINVVRTRYKKAMKVNDGIRIPGVNTYGATLSTHFDGNGIDIDDNINGDLWKWLMLPEQMVMLQELGLWLEHGSYTHYVIDPKTNQEASWVHFQRVPPKSGKRIYIPSTKSNPNSKFWDGKYDPRFDKDLSKAA